MRRTSALRGRVTRPFTTGILTLAAVGATVLGATPAEAKAMSAKLAIDRQPVGNGKYRVYIDALVPMNKYDADGYVNNGAHMTVDFHADDPGRDLFGQPRVFSQYGLLLSSRSWWRYDPGLFTSEQGIHLKLSFLAPGDELNEDDDYSALFGNARDELYYTVEFTDGDGKTTTKTSNIVTGYFCC